MTKIRALAFLLLTGLVLGLLSAVAPQAGAAVQTSAAVQTGAAVQTATSIQAAASTPATVTADALPTWQVNGVVWDTVTVGNTVYATGDFTKTRPPGAAAGSSSEIDRKNLLAFDLTTGVVTSFTHTLNGPGRRIVASPDGKTIYVGGEFTTVDGETRDYVAAFDVASGDLVPGFHPAVKGRVLGIAATGSTVYLGGDIRSVGGVTRSRLAAVSASTGKLLNWKPAADNLVNAIVVSGSRVIIGGKFQHLAGRAKVGIGAVSATTGRPATWTSRPIPSIQGAHYVMVTDLVLSDGVVYGGTNGAGHKWFDGRFAAKASNGALVWLDNCYGATYSLYVSGSVLYSVGHAHDCSSLGAFGEVTPRTAHRALAETTYPTRTDTTKGAVGSHYSRRRTPTLLNWFPTVNAGTFTGTYQGAWAITGNGTYIALAGEFTQVNGVAQQGLVRFAVRRVAPDAVGPVSSSALKPVVSSNASGTASVRWTRTWDQDDSSLTYKIYRDDDTLVSSLTAVSHFWTLKTMSFTDQGLTPGSRHTYRVVVVDPDGNQVSGAKSDSITVE